MKGRNGFAPRVAAGAWMAALSLALAACGGGGGGSTVRPDPPPPTGVGFTPNVANDASLTRVNAPELPTQAPPAALPQYSQHLQVVRAAGALGAGLTGQGVTIGFVDTGVNRNHPALSGRVNANFINVNPATNNTSVDDVVGHGTVVAQIAAGRSVGNWGGGVAPGAGIVSSRIISDAPPDDDGTGEGNEIRAGEGYGDFFRAINGQLANAGARIINNSWGGLYWNDAALTSELASAYREFVVGRGGLIVFANGNAGDVPSLRANPSDNAALPSLSAAAADLERGWLTVAALDPDNPVRLTDYSQACGIAMNYCLAAPGNVVFIDPDARVGDASYDLYRGGGTSFAAPQVSGTAAVVWSAFPYFDNDLVRQTLLGTARDLGAPGVDAEFGWGVLDVSRAANGPGNFAWGDVSVSFAGYSAWRNEIVGSGGLIKSGSGVLALANYQSYTGRTRVLEGGLDIRYGLSSDLSISNGAIVWARGDLDGDVDNSGLFLNSAENEASIVNGHHFTQTATGNLGIWLGSPLRVGGAANLGGQVSVLGVKRGYVTKTRETLLTAFGGVQGTFSRLMGAPNVFLQASLAYDPNNVYLDIARIDVSRAVAALSLPRPTQSAAVRVEAAMTAIDGQQAGTAPAAIGDAFIEGAARLQQVASVAEADAALRSLSGELHAVADAMTYDVIGAGRRALGARAAEQASRMDGASDWYRALGQPGQGALGIARYQADGWMLGSDGRIGARGFAGMAFGEARASGGVQGGRDRGRDRQTQAMAYAGGQWDGAHLVGLLGAGRFDRQVDRGLLLGERMQGVASGYSGRYFTASAEAGRRFGRADAWWTPYTGMEYVRMERDGFIETGADGFGLVTRDSRTDRLQAFAGLRAGRRWNTSMLGPVALNAHAEWQRTLDGRGLAWEASFVGADSWAPLGLSDRTGRTLGAALELAPWRETTLTFGYDLRDHGGIGEDRQWSSRLRVGF